MARNLIKVYNDDASTYLGVLEGVSDIRFSKLLDGGLGELTIRLPRKIDDFGEGDQIDLMNRVEVHHVDDTYNPSGTKVYSGFIDTYTPVVEGTREYVDILCLGYPALLDGVLYRNSTDITIVHNSVDVDAIFKDIFDKYTAIHTKSPVDYDGTSVETGGNNISLSFNSLTCMEALGRLVGMAGSSWHWYVGADNVAKFFSKPTTATHTFVYGRDILNQFEYTKSVRHLVNRVLFWNGQYNNDTNPISRYFYDDTNVGSYWERVTKVVDSRITSATYARNLSEPIIDSLQNANHQISFVVTGNGNIDHTAIEPGDTCQILNVADSSVFSNNMLITQVDYSLDSARIITEDLTAYTSRGLTGIRRELNKRTYDNGQPNYTSTDVS